jgi:hypothetical protein
MEFLVKTEHAVIRRPARRGSPRRSVRGAVAVATAVLVSVVAGGAPSGSVAAAAAPDAWSSQSAGPGNALVNAGESVITAANASRVTKAWTATEALSATQAPAVVNGVVYYINNPRNTSQSSTFTAASAKTGATLWTLTLAPGQSSIRGMSISGRLAVFPYDGAYPKAGGVTAVDLSTHKVAWTRSLPAPAISWMGNSQAGEVATDGARVYVPGAGNVLNTYRLADGAPLWSAPVTFNLGTTPDRVNGYAVGSGLVYTGGLEGIVAYDVTTGKRRWTAPGYGAPVVAGGRVYSSTGTGVIAVNANGCGAASCPALFTKDFSKDSATGLTIGATDATTMFVSYTRSLPPAAGSTTGRSIGVIARLATGNGAVQWSASLGRYSTPAVRGGNTIWVINEYADSSGVIAYRILGLPATGTSTTPLRTIAIPQSQAGFPQSLAIAGGTLFDQGWVPAMLTGYRIPGT